MNDFFSGMNNFFTKLINIIKNFFVGIWNGLVGLLDNFLPEGVAIAVAILLIAGVIIFIFRLFITKDVK